MLLIKINYNYTSSHNFWIFDEILKSECSPCIVLYIVCLLTALNSSMYMDTENYESKYKKWKFKVNDAANKSDEKSNKLNVNIPNHSTKNKIQMSLQNLCRIQFNI